MKEDINAVMRRMSNSTDAKITFREFSLAITPELSGLNTEATANLEFNTEKKAALAEEHHQKSLNRVNRGR